MLFSGSTLDIWKLRTRVSTDYDNEKLLIQQSHLHDQENLLNVTKNFEEQLSSSADALTHQKAQTSMVEQSYGARNQRYKVTARSFTGRTILSRRLITQALEDAEKRENYIN